MIEEKFHMERRAEIKERKERMKGRGEKGKEIVRQIKGIANASIL